MPGLLKVVLVAVGALAAGFVLLVAVVAWIIEPDDYRPLVQDVVSESTGRDFELQGPLTLDWWPCCSIALGPSRLGNPPGFPDGHFARIESAALRLMLWPLLFGGEVQIGAVSVDGVDVALVELPDGRVNWALGDDAESAATGDDAGSPVRLQVDSIELRNGRLSYQGPEPGAAYTVSGLSVSSRVALSGDDLTLTDTRLSATVAAPEVPIPLETRLGLANATVNLSSLSGRLEALEASVEAAGARLDLDGAGSLEADAASLAGTLRAKDFDPRPLLAALGESAYQPADGTVLRQASATARWTLDTSRAALEDLEIRLDDSLLAGRAGVDNLADPKLVFDLSLDGIELDGYLPPTTAAAGAAPTGAAPAGEIPLSDLAGIAVDGRLRIGRLGISGMVVNDVAVTVASAADGASLSAAARLGGGRVDLKGSGPLSGSDPHLAGTLTVESLSPRALLTELDAAPVTANADALTRLAGNARWRLTPRSLGLDAMRWQLDETRISGELAVTDLDSAATRFDLTLDRLDLDGYLAPDDTAGEQQPDDAAAEIPVDAIRALNLQGRLAVKSFTLLGLRLSDAAIDVTAADGVLRLNPIQANLYGGAYRGQVMVDATGSKARLTLEQQLSAVQVGQLLGTLYQTDRLDGAFTVELSGSGTGNGLTELLGGLTGQFALSLADGVFRGVDLGYELQSAQARLKQEPAPPAPQVQETRIRTLSAAGQLADGVLGSNRLSAETPFLRLDGKGGVNLLERSLDLDLNAQVPRNAAGSLAELSGLTIPLTVQGSLLAPRVGVDLKGLVTTTVREQVKSRARDALLERLGGSEKPAAEAEQKAAGAAEKAAGAAEKAGGAAEQAGDAAAAPEGSTEPEPEVQPEPETPKDLLKQRLRDLIKPPPK